MGVLLYFVYLLGGLTLGAGLAASLARWPRSQLPDDDVTRFIDGATTTLLGAFATWIALGWILSLTGLLTEGGVLVGSVVALSAGAPLLARSGALARREYAPAGRPTAFALVALLPVILWLVFVVWRGTVLPVYNHDALAYHFPKAALLVESRGFHVFAVPEPRIASWPCDYEILVASVFLVTGSDALTATLSNLAFVAFLLAAARLAAVWWGRGLHVALSAALVASAPLVILHSGLQKNDLLFAFFVVSACAAAGRWYARGCAASLVIATVATELAMGTKVSGAFLVPGVAIALALGARRARDWVRPRLVFACVGAAVAAALLLGAWSYLASLAVFHSPALPPELPGDGYGDYSNLWRFTYLLLAVPFSSHPGAVWNPWAAEPWWWPENDVWMSHFGRAFTVLVGLVLPIALLTRFADRLVRFAPRLGAFKAGDGEGAIDGAASVERAVASLLALAAYALTVPVRLVPLGFFSGVGRYVLFVVPIVCAWSVPALALGMKRALRRWTGAGHACDAVLAMGAAALSAQTIWAFGVNDAYAPVAYLSHEIAHPEDRRPFIRRNRAASVFDMIAPRDATCAIDVGFDTWIYPAYGAGWTRKVVYLPRTTADATVPIPDAVDWVIVDRSYQVFFGHPDFVDMGKAWRYLGRGAPTAADRKVADQLASDPRFDLVYADPSQNQALFRRKGAKMLELPRFAARR
jgi:4-amino-4-deoxy-L-arabinose transferase-like glycosyltransferase